MLPYFFFLRSKKKSGIGSFDEVFEGIIAGTIKTRGILVSPPSSIYLHDLAVGKIKIILEMIESGQLKPLNIVLAISSTKEIFIIKNEMEKYIKQKKIIEFAYHFKTTEKTYELVPHKLSQVWYEYYF